MSKYQLKRLYLSEKNIEYIKTIKERNDFPDDSIAIRTIINEHQEMKMKLFDLNFIVASLKDEIINDVSKFISSDVLEEIRRVRLGTNNTDRNSQILIELLTSWMLQSNVSAIMSTDKYKPDFLAFAETAVGNRIAHQKQKKDDKAYAKMGGN